MLGVLTALAACIAVAAGVVALLERNTLPARTSIGGVEVGGRTEREARAALVEAASRARTRPIRLLGPGGATLTTGVELGAVPAVEEALQEARDVGRPARLLRRLGIGSTRQLPLDYRLGPVRAARVSNRLDLRFGEPSRDAAVVVSPREIVVEPAAPGRAVDRGALRRALRTLPDEVGIERVLHPLPARRSADLRAAARVERLVAEPRRVAYRDVSVTLPPRLLRRLAGTERSGGSLVVRLEPEGLERALRPRLRRFEQKPRDARFSVTGNRVRVVPSRPGTVLDGERIARSLAHDLDSTTHRARFTLSQPELTTQEAQALGIREKISEFTTFHPCCAPRVANIHRGADIIDGTVVPPGGRFDLNEVMGERTPERGFLAAPQIFNGRLEDAVGGGISQIATTMYNAAFFGGMEIITHQPHEFYISRYPMGREATISWGGPELIWRNDWSAGVLVDMSYTDTSITVRLFSSRLGRKVTTSTGEPCCYVSPRTITVRNPSLPAGTTTTVQSAGPSGFTISYTRKVFQEGKLKRDERYTWRYRAENAIVEVGPPARARPPKKGAAKPPPKQPQDATPSPGVEPPGAPDGPPPSG